MDWMLVIVAVVVGQVVGLSGAYLALSFGLRAMNVLAMKRAGVGNRGAGRLP